MKKFIFAACAALMLVAASCSKGDDAKQAFVPKQISDSISICYGTAIGGYVLNDYQRFEPAMQNEQTKKDIVKGIQLAFANANSDGVIMGMQVAGQMLNELKRFEAQGVDINRNEIIRNFRKAFLADTLDMETLRNLSNQLNTLMSEVDRLKAEHEAAMEANTPDAKDNIAAGEAYVKQIKDADPTVQTSSTGLTYKIIEEGEGPKIGQNTMATVKYTGKLIDGTVFDQSPEGSPATFSPAGVVPGFGEGLKLLGKGGKATLYIPGELAYGTKGVPQAGIGPNAMLIFDIEIVDIQE